MAAIAAPKVGEAYLDNAMRVQYVTFGDSTSDIPQAAAIADTEAGNAVVEPIFSWGAGGITIFGVHTRVVTAFKAGTTISLGCDSDASATAASYWLTSDKVAATAAEVHRLNSTWIDLDTGGSATLTNGIAPMYYSGTGTLELTFIAGDSDQTVADTGQLEVGIWYIYGQG